MIEPFGLLNFIQSALRSAPTPPQTDENTERQTAAPPQACEDGSTQPNESATPQDEPQKSNPFLNFCEEHDRRAKRIKRNQ